MPAASATDADFRLNTPEAAATKIEGAIVLVHVDDDVWNYGEASVIYVLVLVLVVIQNIGANKFELLML